MSKHDLQCSGSIARFGNKFRFTLFIISFGIPIILSLRYLTTISEGSPFVALVAAFLGGIIPLAPIIYINFVAVPDLKIIYNSDAKCAATHRPSLYHKEESCDRQHIRVIVKNEGQKVAKSCSALIQLTERVDGCMAFSGEPKSLFWVSSVWELKTAIDIAPYGGEQFLEVIFSNDHEPVSWDATECKIEQKVDNKGPLRAYASTPPTYTDWRNRDQDGFCQGRFRIILTVYSETAKPRREKFELNIPKDWNRISMTQLKAHGP